MPTTSKRAGKRTSSTKKSAKTATSTTPKQHMRGATPKENRMYEHIKTQAQREGRYGSRAKEVAARTVNKMKRKKRAKRSS